MKRTKKPLETSDEVSSAAGRMRALRRNHKGGIFIYVARTGKAWVVTDDVMACASSAQVQDQTKGKRRK
jgi:hypothetical protein